MHGFTVFTVSFLVVLATYFFGKALMLYPPSKHFTSIQGLSEKQVEQRKKGIFYYFKGFICFLIYSGVVWIDMLC